MVTTGVGTDVGILLSSKCIDPNGTFWNYRNTRMSVGTHWTYCESDVSQNSINHLTSISQAPTLKGRPHASWGLLESVLILKQYPADPGKSVSFPPVYSYPCKRL